MEDKNTNINSDLTNDNSENSDINLLEDQLNNVKDQYMHLYADFENYKKRVQKEKEEIKNNTKISMITSILDMDNDIELAIKNIKDDSAKEGVSLIASKIQSFLKNHGIEPIQTDSYDEDLHEVISVLEVGENKIVDVVSKGYSLNGKPFRYPKIILGK